MLANEQGKMPRRERGKTERTNTRGMGGNAENWTRSLDNLGDMKCQSCRWLYRVDRVPWQVCCNPDSEYVSEGVDNNDWCDEYERSNYKGR